MRRARVRAGGLDGWMLEPEDPSAADWNVLLCHGFGAPGDDLVPLATEIAALSSALAARVRWIFPEAPLTLEEQGSPWGRAWWHLDLERLVIGRDWARYSEEVPDGLPKARRMLRAHLEEIAARTKVPFSRTVLGGFSQGGMLTTDLALRLEEAPAGLVVLSGTLLSRAAWVERAAHRASLPVFQSHGTQDPLLPFEYAEKLHQLLRHAGMTVRFVPFQGQHTISVQVLRELAGWLEERIASGRAASAQ